MERPRRSALSRRGYLLLLYGLLALAAVAHLVLFER